MVLWSRNRVGVTTPFLQCNLLNQGVMNLTPELCPGRWEGCRTVDNINTGTTASVEQEILGNLPLSRLRKIKQTFNIIMSSAVQKMLELYLFFPFLSGPLSVGKTNLTAVEIFP